MYNRFYSIWRERETHNLLRYKNVMWVFTFLWIEIFDRFLILASNPFPTFQYSSLISVENVKILREYINVKKKIKMSEREINKRKNAHKRVYI